jgi:hypothetical protein
MKIELDKEDFVRLAVYASCADLPEEENKCGMTLRKVMDSLDEEDANAIAGDMLALIARIEVLNGASAEDVLKTIVETIMEDDEELDLDENDGDALKHLKRMMEEGYGDGE